MQQNQYESARNFAGSYAAHESHLQKQCREAQALAGDKIQIRTTCQDSKPHFFFPELLDKLYAEMMRASDNEHFNAATKRGTICFPSHSAASSLSLAFSPRLPSHSFLCHSPYSYASSSLASSYRERKQSAPQLRASTLLVRYANLDECGIIESNVYGASAALQSFVEKVAKNSWREPRTIWCNLVLGYSQDQGFNLVG